MLVPTTNRFVPCKLSLTIGFNFWVYAVFMVKESHLGYLLPSGCPVELHVEYKLMPPKGNQHIARLRVPAVCDHHRG